MPDAPTPPRFDYQAAFSRNVGWVTADEQAVLRSKRVAIAGLGGVGGFHLLTLARLGIARFNLADFDRFDLPNFNRQAGAALSTIGRPKLDALVEAAKDINPEIDVRPFPEGVTSKNLREFLADVDLYVDGLDFFAVAARRETFAACTELGIPAVTAAPLGMGVALLNFLPGRMTFEEYFRLEGRSEGEQLVRFLVGLSPAMLQRGYLVDRSRVNLAEHRGPSTVMACHLCAGVAATEVAKILLKRGDVLTAPWGLQFDAYRGKLKRTWRPGGNRNPIQRLAIAIASRQLGIDDAPVPPKPEGAKLSTVEQILDLARWAPSGDNTQPWRFEIVADDHVVVHGFDTRRHCVYDVDGRPSQISIGALLENIAIAASTHGLEARIELRPGCAEEHPVFDVRLRAAPVVVSSPLAPAIVKRSVQRRPMKTTPLPPAAKDALERAAGDGYTIAWFEGWASRLRVARLLFRSARLRLIMPEAYLVHRDIIQWGARFSEDRVPDQALGLDPLTLKLMRPVMARWERVEFFNRYLGGTLMPRIQLDLVPGIACAAHFVILAPAAPARLEDYVAAGRAMQRFWLTATSRGLHVQPEMTPLIFAAYAGAGKPFSRVRETLEGANRVRAGLEALLGRERLARAVFMGRVGAGPAPKARSLRRPLNDLLAARSDPAEAPGRASSARLTVSVPERRPMAPE